MNNDSSLDRFLELDAGRALGDLTPDEVAEWKQLVEIYGNQVSEEIPLDDLVGALETAMTPDSGDDNMPASLKATVQSQATGVGAKVVDISAGKKPNLLLHPALGWAVAACLALTLIVQNLLPVTPPDLVTEIGGEQELIRLEFSRLDATFGNISGEVVWSDRLQKGYMKLSGVKPNNPNDQQFQLWIFDPERDSNPVDGGVFDIANNDEVIVPIDAKLQINKPDAFAITVEQPGGVVVSKRELLLALAK